MPESSFGEENRLPKVCLVARNCNGPRKLDRSFRCDFYCGVHRSGGPADEQEAAEVWGGVQVEGSPGSGSRREDDGRIGLRIRGHANQISSWKKQLLEGVPELFADLRWKPQESSVSVQELFEQIGRLLKTGVSIDGVVHPTEKGVPQGSVISPLLSNVVLNKLDWFLHGQVLHGNAQDRAWKAGHPNVRFARYANDWCMFITRGSKRYTERLCERIRQFLSRHCGLELSMEKTCITHVRNGFDLLGFDLQLGIGQRGKFVPKIKVPRKALTQAMSRLNEALR